MRRGWLCLWKSLWLFVETEEGWVDRMDQMDRTGDAAKRRKLILWFDKRDAISNKRLVNE